MEVEMYVWRGRGACERGEEHVEGERNMRRGRGTCGGERYVWRCVEGERNMRRERAMCGGGEVCVHAGLNINFLKCEDILSGHL